MKIISFNTVQVTNSKYDAIDKIVPKSISENYVFFFKIIILLYTNLVIFNTMEIHYNIGNYV